LKAPLSLAPSPSRGGLGWGWGKKSKFSPHAIALPERGFTLIELIIAIIVISIAVVALMAAFTIGVRGSADPLIEKQMLAIAEEMMEEILLKPYEITPNPATSFCGGSTARDYFNDVRDYNGYSTTNGFVDTCDTLVPGLASYNVAVTVAPESSGLTQMPDVPSLQITVTVTHGSDSVTLHGFRANPA
jgi:MSHA pilin protein MshD